MILFDKLWESSLSCSILKYDKLFKFWESLYFIFLLSFINYLAAISNKLNNMITSSLALKMKRIMDRQTITCTKENYNYNDRVRWNYKVLIFYFLNCKCQIQLCCLFIWLLNNTSIDFSNASSPEACFVRMLGGTDCELSFWSSNSLHLFQTGVACYTFTINAFSDFLHFHF